MSFRRIAASILFAALFAATLDLRNVVSFLRDVPGRRAFLESFTDRRAPEYPRFLEEVARRTKPGQSIAIVFPTGPQHGGYGYAYQRASYFLAGRRVIPLVDREGRFHAERIAEADYFAFWNVRPSPRAMVVWQGHRGALVRGRR